MADISLLGLAMKAGAVVSGEFAVEKAIQSKKAYLVIVANDASDNTKKKFSDLCNYYGVKFFICATKEELGNRIGKEFRASVAVVSEGFANSLIKKMESDL